MNKFRSVKIIHDIIHRIDFSYLAELFRFMGILVCEEILVETPLEPTQTEMNTVYSAVIYVGGREISKAEEELLDGGCSAAEYARRIKNLPSRTVFLCDCGMVQKFIPEDQSKVKLADKMSICHLGKDEQKCVLKDFFGRVLDSVFGSEDPQRIDVSQVEDLISVYVEHEVWLHSMNMQYYPNRASDMMEEARAAFLESQKALKSIVETRQNGNAAFLYEYAKLWCEMKTNNACKCNKKILYFIQENIIARCKALCARYPEFSNAKVLLGLCYEPFANSANEAVDAFDSALIDMKTECFSSAVYYWIGKRCEEYPETKKYAEKYFEKANARKVKFRNIFKLAIYARDREEYRRAIDLFETIPAKLGLKLRMRFTDPLEMEYLFKSYVQLCYINYKKEDILRTIFYGEKALDILEKETDSNQYIIALYRGQAPRYRELLQNRCNPEVIYDMLIDCYRKSSNQEKEREYRAKRKERESQEALRA